MQDHRDQQSPEAAVAVEKGVDGLELDMHQGRLEDHGKRSGRVVDEGLQRAPAGLDFLGRRWDEAGVTGSGAADPVLGAAKLAGGLVAAASARHEAGMHLAQEPIAEREALAKAHHAVFQRGNVVGDFHYVVEGDPGLFLEFKEQQIGKG